MITARAAGDFRYWLLWPMRRRFIRLRAFQRNRLLAADGRAGKIQMNTARARCASCRWRRCLDAQPSA